MTSPAAPAPPRPTPRWVKPVVDYVGLAAFMAMYFLGGRNLVTATWALVAGSAIGLAVGYIMERKIAPLPLIAGGAALVFGTLTLIFHDPIFIKMKPTIMNLAFAIALFVGLALKKSPLKILLGSAVDMPDPAWRTLTWRYAFFFLSIAALNEAVWRTQPDATWVIFRFPGLLILTVLFTVSQIPLFMKHAKLDGPPEQGPADEPAETRESR